MAVLRAGWCSPDRNGLYHEYDPILRHHYYSNSHMTDENMERYLEHMARSVRFLHVYPSSVARWRDSVLARDGVRRRISAASSPESEIVYPEQRQMVEEVFGCRYFSCYGHTEKLVLAAECEQSTDYHVWPTYGYFELLDEAGRPVTTPGQRGEIVGTGFINTVMPFIRYRTGDWATYVGDRCEACGREHPIIRDIRGHRTQEMLLASRWPEISWTALNMHDDTFVHVRQFQFLQDTPGQQSCGSCLPMASPKERRTESNAIWDINSTAGSSLPSSWSTAFPYPAGAKPYMLISGFHGRVEHKRNRVQCDGRECRGGPVGMPRGHRISDLRSVWGT